jgi:hypothetical protein
MEPIRLNNREPVESLLQAPLPGARSDVIRRMTRIASKTPVAGSGMKSRRYVWCALAGTALMLPSASQAQIELVSDLRVETEARPGERYGGTLILRNPTDRPLSAKIYQTDYLFFADGRISFAAPGSTSRSNARWVTPAQTFVRIPPRQTSRVPYVVTVPAAETMPLVGTYWSVLMIEGLQEAGRAESATAGRRPSVSIRTVVRHGVQLVTHLAGGGAPEAKFTGTRIVRLPGGGRALEFDLVNTGVRAYRLALSVELFDVDGNVASALKRTSEYLYPGTSARQRFDLSGVRTGTYKVLVLADGGGENLLGAQYTLQF